MRATANLRTNLQIFCLWINANYLSRAHRSSNNLYHRVSRHLADVSSISLLLKLQIHLSVIFYNLF